MRVISGTLCQYYYTFGFFVMAAIAYFLNHNWKLLQVRLERRKLVLCEVKRRRRKIMAIFFRQIVITLPTVVFVSYWWFMPESVRWLISKGKYTEAKDQVCLRGSSVVTRH